jgi:hypothetical protein
MTQTSAILALSLVYECTIIHMILHLCQQELLIRRAAQSMHSRNTHVKAAQPPLCELLFLLHLLLLLLLLLRFLPCVFG